jgi:hypothetical protein
MKTNFLTIAFGLTCLTFWSCNPDAKKNESGNNTGTSNALQSADSSWASMMRSDDAKMANMKRLASELLLIEGADSVALKRIHTKIDSLPAYRYEMGNLENSRIDKYDEVCTAAISALKTEISRIPKATNYQIVNQLVSEISAADDSVLFYRKAYDRSADRYNSLSGDSKKLAVFRVIP